MTIKRRELLQLLSIAGGFLCVPGTDWGHIETSLDRSSHLDITVVSDLETINTRCWSLFRAASLKASVLDGVLGQLKMQVQFLKAAQTRQIYQRLCALTSCMSQLAGEIYFDLHDHNAAQACYIFAATSAREANAYDLWASALVRHSYLPLFAGRFEDALPLLKQAKDIAQRGDPTLPTAYWVAATCAEAQAGVGSLAACQRAFEQASNVYNLTEKGPDWIRFDGSRLPELQGACYVRLGQPERAEPLLQEALQQNVKSSRRHAMILADLALSALQQTDVERACAYGDEVVTLTNLSSSGFLHTILLKIEQQLTPFADVEAVRSLKKRVALLA